MSKFLLTPLVVVIGLALGLSVAHSQRIQNRVAVFSGIDKITGVTHTFDVYIDDPW